MATDSPLCNLTDRTTRLTVCGDLLAYAARVEAVIVGWNPDRAEAEVGRRIYEQLPLESFLHHSI